MIEHTNTNNERHHDGGRAGNEEQGFLTLLAHFRDPQAWEYFAQGIAPQILRNADADAPIRYWPAGCASEKEPYTPAMVMAVADLFESLSLKHRVFVRAQRRNDREQLLQLDRGAEHEFTPLGEARGYRRGVVTLMVERES